MPRNTPQPKEDGGRASWKGNIRIHLVSFPVAAYNVLAPDAGSVHFRQLHVCHTPIQNQRVCPIHGVVPNEEVISGYEYETGRYVEFEAEELKTLRARTDSLSAYDNSYRDRVMLAVQSKLEGRPMPLPVEARPSPAVSLREALTRSLEVEHSRS